MHPTDTAADRLKRLREEKGLSQKELADLIGTSNQQISRLEKGQVRLNTDWMHRLADALSIDPAVFLMEVASESHAPETATGFAESAELFAFTPPPAEKSRYDKIVDALYPGNHPGAALFAVKSRALDLAGLPPESFVIVDLNLITPTPGQIVCLQLYDWKDETAQTILRIYEPPYLLARSTDPAYAHPYRYDQENVTIKGTVIASFKEQN